MQESLYVVISADGCWGAAESLETALRYCDLIEETRLSHFDWVMNQSELNEVWEAFNRDKAPVDDPTDVVIYYLDHEVWDSFQVNDVDGSFTAYPKDPSVTTKADLSKVTMTATYLNGALKPRRRTIELPYLDKHLSELV